MASSSTTYPRPRRLRRGGACRCRRPACAGPASSRPRPRRWATAARRRPATAGTTCGSPRTADVALVRDLLRAGCAPPEDDDEDDGHDEDHHEGDDRGERVLGLGREEPGRQPAAGRPAAGRAPSGTTAQADGQSCRAASYFPRCEKGPWPFDLASRCTAHGRLERALDSMSLRQEHGPCHHRRERRPVDK